jgi:hypothetical protein
MAASELKDGKTYRTRDGRLLEAIIAIADCDDEDETEWHRAWCRFNKTLRDLGYKQHVRRVCQRTISNQLPLPWRNPGMAAEHTS